MRQPTSRTEYFKGKLGGARGIMRQYKPFNLNCVVRMRAFYANRPINKTACTIGPRYPQAAGLLRRTPYKLSEPLLVSSLTVKRCFLDVGNLTRRYFVWNSGTLKALGYRLLGKRTTFAYTLLLTRTMKRYVICALAAIAWALNAQAEPKDKDKPQKDKDKDNGALYSFQIPAAPSCF